MNIPPMWGHISLVNRYIYVENPKVCCSTIKGRLFALEAERSPIVAKRIHDLLDTNPGGLHNPLVGPLIRSYQLPEELLKNIITSQDFLRFSFVRDPYSRVLSAYLDKMTKKGSVRQSMINAGFPGDLDFPSFVRLLNKHKKALMHDKHWRPQHINLQYNHVDLNFIGRFENFEEDFLHIWKRIAPNLESREDVRVHKTSASEKLKEYYDEKTALLVAKVYRKDFEAFGYPREPAFLA